MPEAITREMMEAFAAEMSGIDWLNPGDRRAVALKILEYVVEDIIRQDLESLLVSSYDFKLGESPQWITRKGLKAYVHEPGSISPRSTITQKVLTISTEQVSVHPEFELNQLRAGRYGSLMDIKDAAVSELLGRKYSIIWSTIIGSITSSDTNYATYATGASAATKKTAIDTAIDYVNDTATGGAKAIVGRYSTLGWLIGVEGWSEITKHSLETTEGLGSYRGIPLVRLNQYTDGYGNKLITDNELLVVGTGSTKLGRNQGLEVLDAINVDDKMWHMRIDEQYGVVVHYPERNYRIHIT